MSFQSPSREQPVVLFDENCPLCRSSVRFIIRHDPSGLFRFQPLHSPPADTWLADAAPDQEIPDSLVYLDGHEVLFRGDAAVRIGRRMGRPWSWAARVGSLLPGRLRDGAYKWIARNRYRWFGEASVPLSEDAEILPRIVAP